MSKIEDVPSQLPEQEQEQTLIHPFFTFEEPTNAIECLHHLRLLLDQHTRTLTVAGFRSDNLLEITWEQGLIPKRADFGFQRAINLMKRFSDNESVLDDASVILAHVSGECTRPA